MGSHKFRTIMCLFVLPMFSSKLSFDQLQLSVSMIVAGVIIRTFAATLMQ